MTLFQRLLFIISGLILLLAFVFLVNKNLINDYRDKKTIELIEDLGSETWSSLIRHIKRVAEHEAVFLSLESKGGRSLSEAELDSLKEQQSILAAYAYVPQTKQFNKIYLKKGEDDLDTKFLELQYDKNENIQILQDFEDNYFFLFSAPVKGANDKRRIVILIDFGKFLSSFLKSENHKDYIINQRGVVILGDDPGFLDQLANFPLEKRKSGFFKNTTDHKNYLLTIVPLSYQASDLIGYWVSVYDQTDFVNHLAFWDDFSFIFGFFFLLLSLVLVFYILRKHILPLELGIKSFEGLVKNDLDSFRYFNENIPDYEQLENYCLILRNRQIAYQRIQLQKNKFQHNLLGYYDLKKELDVAAKIQLSVLPEPNPAIEKLGINLHAKIVPAKEVGGDFYDYFKLSEDKIGIVMADVSGKGVPAALFMVLSRTLLKAHAREDMSIVETITKTNELLSAQNPEMMFVTLIYGVYDMKKREFEYVVAGHPPIYAYEPDKKMSALPLTKNIALGINPNAEFQSKKIKLKKNQTLFLYTDGITEALNIDKAEYGFQFVDLFSGENIDPEQLLNKVFQHIRAFSVDVEQSDDITMLAFRAK